MNCRRWLAWMPALLLISLSACDEDSTIPIQGEADVTATLTLTDPYGGAPEAGDSLVARLAVANSGNGKACAISLTLPLIERFDLLSTSLSTSASMSIDSTIRVSSFDLAEGDSVTLSASFGIPPFVPDGWPVSMQAELVIDDDCAASTDSAHLVSDNPATTAVDDATSIEIPNEGMDFTLLAPGVQEVYLAGEFNGWVATDPDYLMYLDASGREWSLTLPLQGRQSYKFVLSGTLTGYPAWITDPRATHLDPDGFGGYNALAGLSLPNPVSPLPGGIEPSTLVIYELFTDDFSDAGDFEALMTGIDGGLQNLVDLGVNAIELLPVTTAPPGFNWGYTPAMYFAVDPDYGTPEEMAALVEKAHSNGIAVILDMVFNHVANDSPLPVIDQHGTSETFINYDQGTVFGMLQTNWFSEDMRGFFLDAALFWIEQYGIDGFRMDLVDHRDYAGYRWWRDEIKARHPEFFIIGEDFNYPPSSCVGVAGMDAQWGGQHTDSWGGNANNFQHIVMALLKEGPYDGRAWQSVGSFETDDNPMWALANVLESTAGFPSFHNEVKYIVSHDEHRVVWEVDNLGSPGASAIGGVQKAKLGAATLLTTVGIPMLYMGEEIGEDGYVPQHPAPNEVDWLGGNADVRTYYQNLIHLRLNHPSLATGNIAFFCPLWEEGQGTCQANKTICYWRDASGTAINADIVVVLNFDHADHGFAIPFPVSGTWYDYDPESGIASEVDVAQDTLQVTLAASTAYIYLKDTTYIR
ncbi:alpha-amylase family glycosyl hydrolase [Candidatus Eisenbacteria bacterium]|uniref:Alpha-amylase family glycosyl hydrolase n=1 Tax=Eiseniibacteriota bacterium TaxID=2212470 RepID=A0ABV6YI51_UNCEI